jgi:hypothetical protein
VLHLITSDGDGDDDDEDDDEMGKSGQYPFATKRAQVHAWLTPDLSILYR